jgi:hypothetical protein
VAVEDPEECVAVAQVSLVDGRILHALAPPLHLGLAEDDSAGAPLLDALAGVRFREIHTHAHTTNFD